MQKMSKNVLFSFFLYVMEKVQTTKLEWQVFESERMKESNRKKRDEKSILVRKTHQEA